MGLIGKIVGGTIGFALGGPLGAIAGAVCGHAYDNTNSTEGYSERVSGNNYNRASIDEHAQMTFFVAAFSMLAKLAKTDGIISKEEINSVEKFMAYDLNLDPQSQMIARNIFKTAVNSGESFHGFATQFYNHFQYQTQHLELMIDILLRVALSDGALSRSEEELILDAVNIFGFSDEQYMNLKSRYVKDIDNKYYGVLGCRAGDTDEHIKKMYRQRVLEYHPDKIASKGLPEEFTKFANDKFREIQEAYDMIKKERGIT
jgi:DnaJ like chaperone protein